MDIRRASEQGGIELISQFKYLRLILSAHVSTMIQEAKRVSDKCTMAVAQKLSKINCTQQSHRTILYQCVVVAFTSYHFVPLIVADLMSPKEAVDFTIQVQKKIATGQNGGKAQELAMLLTPMQTDWLNEHFKKRVNVIRSRVGETSGMMF